MLQKPSTPSKHSALSAATTRLSDSESESEVDTVKSNEVKKRVLNNVWRRNPNEANKKKTTPISKGKKQQNPAKRKVGNAIVLTACKGSRVGGYWVTLKDLMSAKHSIARLLNCILLNATLLEIAIVNQLSTRLLSCLLSCRSPLINLMLTIYII